MVSISSDPGFLQEIETQTAKLMPSGFTPELVPWGAGPNVDKTWIPEDMTPLAGSLVYQDLSDEQKLRYNQYCALEMIEKLAWIESYGITPALVSLLAGDLPTPALRELLQSVLVDELNHTAAEWQLLRLARKDLYTKNKFVLFNPPPSVYKLVNLISRMPRLLSGWVLFCGSLEERLNPLSKRCEESGSGVDPLFTKVLSLHAEDEARHKEINELIERWLIEPQGKIAKWINGQVLKQLNLTYYDTGWGGDGPVLQLIKDFPQLADQSAHLIDENQRVRTGQAEPVLVEQQPVIPATGNIELFPVPDSTNQYPDGGGQQVPFEVPPLANDHPIAGSGGSLNEQAEPISRVGT